MNRPERRANCHSDKKHYAKGLCLTCYNKQDKLKPNHYSNLQPMLAIDNTKKGNR